MPIAYKVYQLNRLFIGTPTAMALDTEKSVEQRTLASILDAVHQIRYGSVEIVIHDGRIVAIERREKVRLDKDLGQRA